MSKKNKKAKQKKEPLTMNKAVKSILPVVIGVVLIAVLAVVFWAVNRDRQTPRIENPKDVFLTIDGHQITNEELYQMLRYSQGISEVKEILDTKLLANYELKTDAKWYQDFETFKEEFIVGSEYEGTDDEKAEEIADWMSNIKQSGYTTDEAVEAYLQLQYKRSQYAKEKYYGELQEDHEASEYVTKYNALHEGSYTALFVAFDSQDEAKEIMKLFGIDANKSTAAGGFAEYIADVVKGVDFRIEGTNVQYKYADQDDTKYTNLIALSDINDSANGATTLEGATWFTKGVSDPDDANGVTGDLYFDSVTAVLYQKGEETWAELKDLIYVDPTVNFLSTLKANEAFINMYNYVNCWYNPTYNWTTNTDPLTIPENEKVLREGVHYEYVDVDSDGVNDRIDLLPAGNELVDLVKYVYKASELTDSNIKTAITTTLSVDKEKDGWSYVDSYTSSPKATSTGSGTMYYLAWKCAEEVPTTYTFTETEATEQAAGDNADAYTTLKAEIKTALDQDYYDLMSSNIQERILYELRTASNLVIYDPFLEAMYSYTYSNFYTSTLKLEEGAFTAFEILGEESKKLAFSFKVGDTDVEITAEDLFQSLKKKYSVILSTDWLYSYILLSNPEFNNIYNPYTDEILDRDALVEAIDTSVKNYKLYFTYDYFSSYGFTSDYGWENFMRDYFMAKNERELAAKLVFTQKATNAFTRKLFTNEDVQTKATAEYEDFFSGKTLNIIVMLSRDGDLAGDTYPVDVEDAAAKFDESTWTTELDALAKELAEKIYTEAENAEGATLSDKLTATRNAYNKALYNDETWGVYKRAGLFIKFETASSEYSNTSSIVEQYMDAMRDIYHDIREANLLGKDLSKDNTETADVVEAPFVGDEAFTTSYGYHMIALTSTTDYTYYSDTDKRWTLTDDELTNYLDYVDDNTVTISDEVKKLGEAYYKGALEEVKANNLVDHNLLTEYRTFVGANKFTFADDANNVAFQDVLSYIESSLEKEDE